MSIEEIKGRNDFYHKGNPSRSVYAGTYCADVDFLLTEIAKLVDAYKALDSDNHATNTSPDRLASYEKLGTPEELAALVELHTEKLVFPGEDGEYFCPHCEQEISGYYAEYCEHCGQSISLQEEAEHEND